ncbi:MAG: C25 family cysteine peptidase, partial [Pyrinomonadaceae bacterium]|nr:C25 family cysteine peptidase [Pyrinomonadaceae bacterium]
IYTVRNSSAASDVYKRQTLNFNLSGVDLTKPSATVSVRFQGYSSGLHQTEIFLNNQQLTTPTSAGQIPYQISQQIPTSALVNGQNSLKMRSVGPTGDFVLFDSVSIGFDRDHLALGNQLFFYALNDRQALVTGFGTANIRLFDTTYEGDPYEFTNLSIQADGAGFRLNVPAQKSKVLYAVEASAVNSPVSVDPINPEMLGVPSHSADLVIIAYRTLLGEAEEWANYRRSQGVLVKVIDVDQIFEEFNYGVLKADSIKAFLSYAHSNWQNAPEYVLLIGDASFDSRNYSGTGFFNLVPARIVNTLFSETASDEFLTDFNNDGLSEISVGRIPGRTPAAIALARDKMVRWESGLNNLTSRGALFAFDNPDGYDFEGMSNRLRQQLPANVPSTMVGRPQADAQAALLTAMNTGKYVTNYSGHGSTGAWAALSFFSVFNVSCTNGQTYCVNHPNNETLFTLLTCLNGFFHNQNADSLAEALLFTNNGGAVAAWASTGETTPDVQEVMGQRFYQQLGAGNILRLGDLIKDAKTQIPAGVDVRLSWALIGDPMLKMH